MRFTTLQSYKISESEGRVICDLASFDSFVKDGNFIVEVKIEIEHFLHEANKRSFYDPYRRELSVDEPRHMFVHSKSNTLPIASYQISHPTVCHPFHPCQNTRFASSTLDRPKPNIIQTQLQQKTPQEYRLSPIQALRRSSSGRMCSTMSTASLYSSLCTQDRASHMSADPDPDQIYSYIPDFFFSDAAPESSASYQSSAQYSQHEDEVFLPPVSHQPHGAVTSHSPDFQTTEINSVESVYQSPVSQGQFSNSTDSVPSSTLSSVTSAPSSIINCIYAGMAQTCSPTDYSETSWS